MTDQPVKTRAPAILYWLFTIALMLILGFSIFLNVGLGIALVLTSPSWSATEEFAADEFPAFEEEWSFGAGEVKAVRMELSGLITRESEAGWFEPPRDKIEDLRLAIRAASHDDAVKAIILELDTPGGGITASDEIYAELLRFKAGDPDRRVVIFMRDLAASGGYYIAMAGDWLIAQPTTVLGSIGVIMQTLNWKGLSERIGVTDTTIKSGDNKDLLNPFRESDPAQLAMLQEMIDRMHERFRGLVSAGRGIDPEQLRQLADGRIFTADQALDLKLIDQVGYWSDVVTKTAELVGADQVKIVRYYRTQRFWDYVAGIRLPFRGAWPRIASPAPTFQYLWQP
ncbi:MAG TPA: signal peptide peptidase SppA [Kiritimatiellia bacterium]|nr:signal peptide peptidase SppA [Kiritimatiellia bacterium]HMO98714.1 signal peptide peptidase SppA [Kiritimatiellia bacterium]HMP97933.1 signal peptide peptidase SppA [Kiritimatiellia bacterium]